MAGVNKVIIVGNLGNDIELKYSTSGSAIANLSIATSDKWTDKNTGQQNEKTEWHRVTIFNKLAEIAGQYLHKGSKVYIEGALRTRKWQDKQGQDRYTTEIIASQMQMLDSRASGDSSNSSNNQQQYNQTSAPASPAATPAAAAPTQVTPENSNDFDDDIPF